MRRGQALVETAFAAPLLVLLLVLPLAAHRWATSRLSVLDAARLGMWEATVAGGPRSRVAGVHLRTARRGGGRVRVLASMAAPEIAPGGLAERASLPRHVAAAFEIGLVSVDEGTEERGRAAVRARWLGGTAAVPMRALLQVLLREDPVRVDFAARPPRGRR